MPNGAFKSKAAAGKFKAEGLKPGVPDIVIPVPRWPFHGLVIEMKKIGEYATPLQRQWQSELIHQGYAAFTCQGHEAALAVTGRYLALPANQWPRMLLREAIEGELEKLALGDAMVYIIPRGD